MSLRGGGSSRGGDGGVAAAVAAAGISSSAARNSLRLSADSRSVPQDEEGMAAVDDPDQVMTSAPFRELQRLLSSHPLNEVAIVELAKAYPEVCFLPPYWYAHKSALGQVVFGRASLETVKAVYYAFPAVNTFMGTKYVEIREDEGISQEIIQFLFRQNPQAAMDRSGPGRGTPLHDACYQGDVDMIQFLVELCPSSANCLDAQGFLPLHRLCQSPQLFVAAIADNKTETNSPNYNKDTRLQQSFELLLKAAPNAARVTIPSLNLAVERRQRRHTPYMYDSDDDDEDEADSTFYLGFQQGLTSSTEPPPPTSTDHVGIMDCIHNDNDIDDGSVLPVTIFLHSLLLKSNHEMMDSERALSFEGTIFEVLVQANPLLDATAWNLLLGMHQYETDSSQRRRHCAARRRRSNLFKIWLRIHGPRMVGLDRSTTQRFPLHSLLQCESFWACPYPLDPLSLFSLTDDSSSSSSSEEARMASVVSDLDETGRLPLHWAIERLLLIMHPTTPAPIWHWNLCQNLFWIKPETSFCRDPRSGLSPFFVVAQQQQQQRKHSHPQDQEKEEVVDQAQLTLMYLMFRENPAMYMDQALVKTKESSIMDVVTMG